MDNCALYFRRKYGHGAFREKSETCDYHHRLLWRVSDHREALLHGARLMQHRSWSVACWAPFAFLGVEINRLNASSSHSTHPKRSSIDLPEAQSNLEKGAASSSSGGASSGQYLGIMNLYTTLPQFMGTGISWVVFSILEPGKSPELSEAPPEEHHSTDRPNAIAVCLFIGACSACMAVVATRRLGRIQGRL